MSSNIPKLKADVRELQRQVNEISVEGDTPLDRPDTDFEPVPSVPVTPPAANQIRNGDKSHSVNTWFETVAAPGTDKVLECAWFFSHDEPITGQALDFTNAIAGAANQTLKAPTHSTYDATYCDWGLPAGISRLTGTKSIDAPLSGNFVYPGRTKYVGFIAALRNETMVVPAAFRLAAMLYDNTPGSEDFIKADAALQLGGQVRGVPAVTTERRWKVVIETDRGYSYITGELIIVGAPSDADFNSGIDVYLSWPHIEGIIRAKIYRHDVTAGKFRFLYEVTSGSNVYGDNNHVEDPDIGAYPTGTDDRVKCYVATRTGALANLPVDGVAAKWAGPYLNIPVPDKLLSAGSGHQVLRIAQTMPLDRRMTDVVSTAANVRVESATGEFTALDTGRTATLYDDDGVTVLHGPELITFVDATHVDFATAVPGAHADVILYIEEGGDHGLLVDMVHAGDLARATYGPHPEDQNRTLPSTAAPNSSSQGGIGPAGDSGDPGDGGLGGCVEISTPVTILIGNGYESLPYSEVRRGMFLKSGNHTPNAVHDLLPDQTENLHIIRTANGIELQCSPGQVLFSSFLDREGTSVSRLKVGDYVLTCVAGRDESSRIIERIATGRRAKVGTFALGPGHRYLAGRVRLPWWKRLLRWLSGQNKEPSGVYAHNLKPVENQV